MSTPSTPSTPSTAPVPVPQTPDEAGLAGSIERSAHLTRHALGSLIARIDQARHLTRDPNTRDLLAGIAADLDALQDDYFRELGRNS